MEIEAIAHIRTDFPTKFGIPRQSGLVDDLVGEIVFEPKYRDKDALRGIEGFSHLWLIWGFSEAHRGGKTSDEQFTPLVRPPRLGGNQKLGVFATRSPFRPNRLALSCVRLDGVVELAGKGAVLRVRGADLLDGTPIYDVKPYIPYTDAHPEALGGFASNPDEGVLTVVCADELAAIAGDFAQPLIKVLERDPRPAYHHDPERVYELQFAGLDVRFTVEEDTLTVRDIVPLH